MIKKIYCLIFVFSQGICCLFAQAGDKNNSAEADSVYSKSIFNNFYLKAEVGGQAVFSADADKLETKDRVSPSYAFEFGKWICPVVGIGIKAQGGTLNGFSTTEGIYLACLGDNNVACTDPVRNEVTINPDGTYRHFVQYTNVSLNFYFSIINIFGYKQGGTFFDLVPSVGIGNMHIFDYKGIPSDNILSANAGLECSFKLAPRWCLNIGANTVFFDNEFEGRIAGDRTYENYISANVGVVYYPRFRGFVKFKNKN